MLSNSKKVFLTQDGDNYTIRLHKVPLGEKRWSGIACEPQHFYSLWFNAHDETTLPKIYKNIDEAKLAFYHYRLIFELCTDGIIIDISKNIRIVQFSEKQAVIQLRYLTWFGYRWEIYRVEKRFPHPRLLCSSWQWGSVMSLQEAYDTAIKIRVLWQEEAQEIEI